MNVPEASAAPALPHRRRWHGGMQDPAISRWNQAVLRDQLDRASITIILNIAEGAGRVSPADKARFYAMARGSATECAAVMDLLWARGLVDPALRNRARSLLVRIVQMLSRLGASMVRSQ